MRMLLTVCALAATLVGCESLYDDSGIPRISSQRQVDAYNATVSSNGEKLICAKEKPLGSNISVWMCMTVNQQERLALQAREEIDFIGRSLNSGNN